jgi:16S rRNA (guanine527-N7)-methyltransferase
MDSLDLLSSLDEDFSPEVVASFERLATELLRWNQRRNLTAITDPEEVFEKHLYDSLTLLRFARQSRRLLDIGSGAGFPSLPIKIACPDLEVVSVDSVGKKIDFQRHMARILGLQKFTALHSRVEELQGHDLCGDGFDLITARALCSLDEFVALAEPFLRSGGSLVAMKGPEGEQEVAACRELLLEKGWRVSLESLSLPRSGAVRCLVEMTR